VVATALPDVPVYCFAPVEDAEGGVQQIRIFVEGMGVTIGTSPVVLGVNEAQAISDRLNRPLGWTRESWTAIAAQYMRAPDCRAVVRAARSAHPPAAPQPALFASGDLSSTVSRIRAPAIRKGITVAMPQRWPAANTTTP